MRQFLLLSILAYVLLIVGLAALERGWVVLALPLIAHLVASQLRGPDVPRLAARRSLSSARAPQGARVSVQLTVTNEGADTPMVAIRDLLPPLAALEEGATSVVGALPRGASLTLDYVVSGERGDYVWRGAEVTVSDPLGIAARRLVLPALNHLLIVPGSQALRHVEIRPQRTHGFAGPIPARQGGPGVEFYGVREYQRGDPLRWINWRASARHPRALFTNEFEQERTADVGLILDGRQRHDIRRGEQSLLEHSVRATAALAEAFLNDGNRVGLLIYGWFLDWTFPGYGKVQRERILRALARARASESVVFESLDRLPARFFPARSQLVLISALCPEDLPFLTRLRAQGYQLLVVSPDPVSFEAGAFAPSREVELAARLARLERRALLGTLRRTGAVVVDWPVDQPLERALAQATGRVPQLLRTISAGGMT
ncbi:MAG: DUF58 domain-containing protein [Chloroflexi bacterium]|nr:DUF58 domain-containing protein [Chloroflexota bacterium]